MRVVQENFLRLKKNYLELQEIHHLLIHSNDFFKDVSHTDYKFSLVIITGSFTVFQQVPSKNAVAYNFLKADAAANADMTHLRLITGVIHLERMAAFERMIWRICHGNVYIRIWNITTPLEDSQTVGYAILSVNTNAMHQY